MTSWLDIVSKPVGEKNVNMKVSVITCPISENSYKWYLTSDGRQYLKESHGKGFLRSSKGRLFLKSVEKDQILSSPDKRE
jgi:hypothetical protein